MEPIVQILKAVGDAHKFAQQSVENDESLLNVIKALTEKVLALEARVTDLENGHASWVLALQARVADLEQERQYRTDARSRDFMDRR